MTARSGKIEMMRGIGIAAALLGVVLGGSCGTSGTFSCADHDDCNGGTCAEGFCAFPADGCKSGLQYGDHAGPLSNLCVPAGDDGTGGSGIDDGSLDGATGVDDGAPTSSTPPVADDSTGDEATTSPPGGDVEFTDDELDGEFGAGTFSGTAFASDRLSLDATASSGTFRSRVFDAGAEAQWTSLRWTPDGPYAKPLPDGGAAESGYTLDAADMDGNVLLLHFESASPTLPSGAQIDDSSGQRSHGAVTGTNGATVVLEPGLFGSAWADDLATFVSIATGQGSALEFGDEDFTWAIWFRADAPCPDNYVFMGVDNAEGGVADPAGPDPHLWLGCSDDEWMECPGSGTEDHLGGVFRSVHGSSDGGFFCHPDPIDDDVWHHAAVSKSGHLDSTIRLYLDGVLVYEIGVMFDEPLAYPDAPDFAIGGFSAGTYPTLGTFDEVAIWRRALTSDEVLALARRGLLSVGLSVRVCSEPDCTDDPPFVGGAELATGGRFVDPPDALSPGTEIALDGLGAGRWIQYEVTMSGRVQGVAPRLASVTLRGQI